MESGPLRGTVLKAKRGTGEVDSTLGAAVSGKTGANVESFVRKGQKSENCSVSLGGVGQKPKKCSEKSGAAFRCTTR